MPSSLAERVAAIEARDIDRDRRLEGHHKTLFGGEGNGGMVSDVRTVTISHHNHVKATDKALDSVTKALVGENGDNGLIGDVGRWKRASAARARLFWILLTAACGEGLAFLVVAFRGFQK